MIVFAKLSNQTYNYTFLYICKGKEFTALIRNEENVCIAMIPSPLLTFFFFITSIQILQRDYVAYNSSIRFKWDKINLDSINEEVNFDDFQLTAFCVLLCDTQF